MKLLTVMAVNPLRKQYGTTQAGCEAVIELINNLIAIILEQREIIAKQAEKIFILEERIKTLEEQLNKNSRNSKLMRAQEMRSCSQAWV
ncbi:MAG: hypothetical protein GQ533_04510 [Methanosarcinaceae archaeon]|nr:hypothetical protein [Methanosarcinaceae archaeon]